jgi:prolyl-tRNA synthetase
LTGSIYQTAFVLFSLGLFFFQLGGFLKDFLSDIVMFESFEYVFGDIFHTQPFGKKYTDKGKKLAINEEVLQDDVLEQLGVQRDELEKTTSIEVGNIFSFGGMKSEQLDLHFKDESGEAKPVILGSYGIGITRLMGAVAEIFADDKGLVWPTELSPFKVHLVSITNGNEQVSKEADRFYEQLCDNRIDVLYDDRDARAGEKFADSDLIGLPYRVVVSKKGKAEGLYEVVERATGEVKKVSETELFALLGVATV